MLGDKLGLLFFGFVFFLVIFVESFEVGVNADYTQSHSKQKPDVSGSFVQCKRGITEGTRKTLTIQTLAIGLVQIKADP